MLIALLALFGFGRVETGKASVEVAAHGKDAELLLGPYRAPVDATSAVTVPAAGGERGGP
jgi:hypothetical protein